jgi:hypothetical protein
MTDKSSSIQTSPTVQSSVSTASFSTDRVSSTTITSGSTSVQTSPTVQSSISAASNQTTVKSSTAQTSPISAANMIILSTQTSDSTIVSTLMQSTKMSYPDSTQTSFSSVPKTSALSSISSVSTPNQTILTPAPTFKPQSRSLSPSITTRLPDKPAPYKPKVTTPEMTGREIADYWGLSVSYKKYFILLFTGTSKSTEFYCPRTRISDRNCGYFNTSRKAAIVL